MGPRFPKRGTAAPTFRPTSIVAKRSPISVTAELLNCDGTRRYDVPAPFHAAGKFCENQLKACSLNASSLLDLRTCTFFVSPKSVVYLPYSPGSVIATQRTGCWQSQRTGRPTWPTR